MMIAVRRISIAFLLFTAPAFPQTAPLFTKLDQVVAAYQTHRRFIGSVLVAKGGNIMLEKGCGMADLELNVPNGPDTKFRLGSITKQFTATASMQLQDKASFQFRTQPANTLTHVPNRG